MPYEVALSLVGGQPISVLRSILDTLPASERLAQAALVVLRLRTRRSRPA